MCWAQQKEKGGCRAKEKALRGAASCSLMAFLNGVGKSEEKGMERKGRKSLVGGLPLCAAVCLISVFLMAI